MKVNCPHPFREVITNTQNSYMGSGFGYTEGATCCTLREILDFYEKNNKTWGTVTIYYGDGNVCKKFDYDTYNNNQFYHNLSGWEYQMTVKEVKFDCCCYMFKNIDIYLN